MGRYHAFSFHHVAECVGIKKNSIVHHFPTKEVLGQAVVERYRYAFNQALDDLAAGSSKTDSIGRSI